MPAANLQRGRSLARSSGQGAHSSVCSSVGRGSTGGGTMDHHTVDRQPDGLPRLASGLDFHCHYDSELHCPVCSKPKKDEGSEGEAHEPGVPSHAAYYVLQPPPPPAPLRSVDEHGLALMMSLQQPKHPPTWWGKERAALQAKCARMLESNPVHYFIIGLTILDLMIVVTELVLSSFYPVHEEVPHAVHVAEEALSWSSISILSVFVAELLAKLLVFGHSYFTRSWWHGFDFVVVVTSLTLELSLKGIAQEVASLLIFFRLWRILRVMHGVAEAMELNYEQEQEHHHQLIHGLQMDLASERGRVRQLEREVAALAAAALTSGLDVPSILRLAAAAASQPDLLLRHAEAAEAEAGHAVTPAAVQAAMSAAEAAAARAAAAATTGRGRRPENGGAPEEV